jgi:hypothetical protein
MTALDVVGSLASVLGLILTGFALYYAKSAAQAAGAAMRSVHRANANEVLAKIGETATQLQTSVENDQTQEAKVRARDLIAEISRFKLRFERFLGTDSKTRIDEAREQVSVMSGILATRGVPDSAVEKRKMLRICHNDVVVVLNEESARILATIEKEEENG